MLIKLINNEKGLRRIPVIRLKKFNRESKRKRFKEKRGKFLTRKANKRIQS